ncbi:MAG: membrane dipeptidase [Armatimonadetes bacterium]|nr:membrane dipeptidase [Armatimonadota bacterium]
MSEVMTELEQRIGKAHARARQLLGASEAQAQAGLELHQNLLVVDTFCLAPSALDPQGVELANQAIEAHEDPADVYDTLMDASFTGPVRDPRAWEAYSAIIKGAGVNAAFRNASQHGSDNLLSAVRSAARFQHFCDNLPGQVVKAVRARDARRAFAEGKYAVFFSSNNPPAMGGFRNGYDLLNWLGIFHRLGYRIMHLAYDRRNWIADGCYEETDAGLSGFGRAAVERFNDLGIIVDVAHSSVQTTLDAASASRAPIAASHTICRALRAHPRGETDESLRAIADTGGFAGITCVPQFLAESGTIVDFLNHIDHAVNVMGIDHVTIGTDCGFGATIPGGPKMLPRPAGRTGDAPGPLVKIPRSGPPPDESESRGGSLSFVAWPYFTVGLKMRGYSDENIGKIVGGNALRVLEEVEAAAKTSVW